MFTPASTFDVKDTKPRGHYYPSPLVSHPQLHEPTSKPESSPAFKTSKHNHDQQLQTSDVDYEKENAIPLRPFNRNTIGTSIDDLICEIDANLSASHGMNPCITTPVPTTLCVIDDDDNALSISDTAEKASTSIPPIAYLVDRFRNHPPTHPDARKAGSKIDDGARAVCHKEDQVDQRTLQGATIVWDGAAAVDHQIESDDVISHKSVSLDWSSFLNMQLSSEDSTISLDESSSLTPKTENAAHESSSFLKKLTGKNYSELCQLVPRQILEPTTESEDMLFQWRLKRKMLGARSNPSSAYDIPKSVLSEVLTSKADFPSVPSNPVIKVTQTTMTEKQFIDGIERKDVCEAEAQTEVSEPQARKDARNITHNKKVMVTPPKISKILSPARCRSSPKTINPSVRKILETECDSDSEISISSFSDDLTVISDLEEIDGENWAEESNNNIASTQKCHTHYKKQALYITERGTTAVLDDITSGPCQKPGDKGAKDDSCSPVDRSPEQNTESVSENTLPEILPKTPLSAELSPEISLSVKQIEEAVQSESDLSDLAIKDPEMKAELLGYLKDIGEFYDDEILKSFITRYRVVIDKIKEVEAHLLNEQ